MVLLMLSIVAGVLDILVVVFDPVVVVAVVVGVTFGAVVSVFDPF